jgi:hypothetical protein
MTAEFCLCGHLLVDDWERVAHVNGRHHYRSWSKADRAAISETSRRREAGRELDPNTVEGRFLNMIEGGRP